MVCGGCFQSKDIDSIRFRFLEMNEQRKRDEAMQSLHRPDLLDGSFFDPIDTLLDHHRRDHGFYRPRRDRPILVPHKISIGDVFGDQTHLTVDRKYPSRPLSHGSQPMQLSDLSQNKRHLRDVESVQLLSSLVVRSIQVHRKYVPFVPGSLSLDTDSTSTFADALTISQMQLHSSSLGPGLGHRLPPIVRPRPSSAESQRRKADAETRAERAGSSWKRFVAGRRDDACLGINLQKAQDMEDILSNLLQNDRASRQAASQNNPSFPPRIPPEAEDQGVTHAWLLEKCKIE